MSVHVCVWWRGVRGKERKMIVCMRERKREMFVCVCNYHWECANFGMIITFWALFHSHNYITPHSHIKQYLHDYENVNGNKCHVGNNFST